MKKHRVKSCLRDGCNTPARDRSNYCGHCWDTMQAESRSRRAAYSGAVGSVSVMSGLITALAAFAGGLVVFALLRS